MERHGQPCAFAGAGRRRGVIRGGPPRTRHGFSVRGRRGLPARCGLHRREQWEHVWDRQPEEDKTGTRLDIPVPPKYAPADFLRASYWSHRGKLDVPKERFISYPDASPDSDATLLLGWAGWDHKDQVQALVNVINDRTEQAGWDTPRLMPLIAGIQELMPWVHQWHGQHDEEWAVTRPRSTRRTWKSSAESTGSRRRTLGPGAGRRRHVAGRRRPTEARV
ncbi:DUF7008 domain-containing protein [Streptomyces sp. NPDC002926]